MLNYVSGVEIRGTKERGRGLFATRDIDKDELIIVEKAAAEGKQDLSSNEVCFTGNSGQDLAFDGAHTELVKKCADLA